MSETIWVSGINAQIYEWVDFGTPPHIITPKASGYPLRFRWGGPGSYKPSSRQRIIQSKRHSQSGGIYTTMSVNHPGVEARHFDETIAKEYEPIFRKDIQDAIGVAAAKTAQSNK